jgi:hypothetical protein
MANQRLAQKDSRQDVLPRLAATSPVPVGAVRNTRNAVGDKRSAHQALDTWHYKTTRGRGETVIRDQRSQVGSQREIVDVGFEILVLRTPHPTGGSPVSILDQYLPFTVDP